MFVTFGKYKDRQWSEVPNSYLEWMIKCQPPHKFKSYAVAELKRRFNKPEVDTLAKVLGMLGSDHDGEVLAAARQAERMRKETGRTWDELLAA